VSGNRQPDERSAGGVVIDGDRVCVIVPRRRTADGGKALALPKGHVDPGESELEAATREVREESGLVCEMIDEVGEVRYWYRRGGRSIDKSVIYFSFKPVGGSFDDHDDEVESVEWMEIDTAIERLTYDGEREMVRRASGR
jgi:8-oxo-dGTP pyrophosphatase MutT (NUDIX family)